MKTRWISIIGLAAACVVGWLHGSMVAVIEPVTFELDWYRNESDDPAVAKYGEMPVAGEALLFTNCTFYDAASNKYGGTNMDLRVWVNGFKDGIKLTRTGRGTYDASNTSWWWTVSVPGGTTGAVTIAAYLTLVNEDGTYGNRFLFPDKIMATSDRVFPQGW